MNKRTTGSHLLPFLWMRGEDEATLREYVGVIQEANCGAFCVESRPHPDFCGDRWWHDMDIILEEAQKREMQVWILDDSHFPTGYANGALREGRTELCRQSLFCRTLTFNGGERMVRLPLQKLKNSPKYPQKLIWRLAQMQLGQQRAFDDDRIISVTAFSRDGKVQAIHGDTWQKPKGNWTVAVCGLSRNLGPHRNYINMMDAESCCLLLREVYEPHWQHYSSLFGKTIAGFFSDEPELGNSVLYAKHNVLGSNQDMPWSRPLEKELKKLWGADYPNKLPLLWLDGQEPEETARIRVQYMDAVTRLVQKNFSFQVGDWCRSHGVRYIGHVIEDNNTHTCTGASLGHYFRGLSGQDMAGIDNIGGQVLPQGEDLSSGNSPVSADRDGTFYHYMLAKLASSAAQLEPLKQGNAMCEIFGNYGWGLSGREMKYMADHFLVRGINHFVPHAFSMAPYPDPDCPPHFYAHGHNPLYRHTGALFGYMERVASMVSGGEIITKAAILYNAEAEWADAKNSMLPQEIARRLYDRQIGYTIFPIDYLSQADRFQIVLVPACKFLPDVVKGLKNAVYIDRLPNGFEGTVVKLDGLIPYLQNMGLPETVLEPASDRVRLLHYRSEQDSFLLVNEGMSVYQGSIRLPVSGPFKLLDLWEEREYAVQQKGDRVSLRLEPGKSLILAQGEAAVAETLPISGGEAAVLEGWRRSCCESIAYPQFGAPEAVTLPDDVSRRKPDFSGFIRYDTEFTAKATDDLLLEISEAWDSMEAFLNGESLGIQLIPPFRYDLGGKLREGRNTLAVEVATTAARDVNKRVKNPILKKVFPVVLHPCGILGTVKLYKRGNVE